MIEEVGLFFVPKKNGDLRLIFDTRRSNCHFRDPPYVPLATPEALSKMETSRGCDVQVSSADVQSCFFYQYSLPEGLLHLFAAPSIECRFLPKWLRATLGRGVAEDDSQFIRFRVRVVPMVELGRFFDSEVPPAPASAELLQPGLVGPSPVGATALASPRGGARAALH